MSLFSSTTTYPLTVFHGTTATLLRAGGAQVPAGFKAEDVILTAQLDRASAKLVARSPLLHTEILHAVGSQMSQKVGPALAADLAAGKPVTKDSEALRVATKNAPLWVANAGTARRAGLRRWKKAKFDAGVKCVSCVLGLASAGAGLASAAASFGATSIPAVFGAWSAVSTTITALAGAWRDVRTSEQNVLRHMHKLQDRFGRELMAQQAGGVVPGAGPQRAPGRFDKTGHAAQIGGNILVSGLKLEPFAKGGSFGPSVSGFRTAIDEYEGKLSHLVREADKLSLILMELLDINEELVASGSAPDEAQLVTNEALAVRIIGNENGGGGITRRRDFFRGPVSIMWLNEYYRVGREMALILRDECKKLLMRTSMNRLDAIEKSGSFLFATANAVGGKADALATGSLAEFLIKAGVLKEGGGLDAKGIAGVGITLSDLGGKVGEIFGALSRKYPDEAKSSLAGDCKVDYLAGARETGLAALETAGSISGAIG